MHQIFIGRIKMYVKAIKRRCSNKYLLLLLLITVGVFLRVWRLTELFHFTYDEEIIAFVGKRMWINHHFPLIGGVTPMHVHLAPYFYWFSGITLFFSKLNPLGWSAVSVLLSICTMVMVYLVSKEGFGKKIALLSVFGYAISFYQNIFDRHYWGLAFNGFISLGVIYSLIKIQQGKQAYIFILAVLLSYGFHTDPSTLVLFIFVIISWLILKLHVSLKYFGGFLIIFFTSFIPLIVFDIRHSYANISGISQYISEIVTGKDGVINTTFIDSLLFIPRTFLRLLYIPGNSDLARQYSYCSEHAIGRLRDIPDSVSVLFIFILFAILAVQFKSPNLHKRVLIKLVGLLLLSTYMGVLIYGVLFKGDLYDHYLSTLFPAFFIIFGIGIGSLVHNTKLVGFFVLFIFFIFNFSLLTISGHRFGFSDKIKAVTWAINETGQEDFALDVIGNCFRYNGYRYLFYLYGKEPTKSYVDSNFTHLYDNPPGANHPKYLIVISNPDFQETPEFFDEYNRFKLKELNQMIFGHVEVMLIDNSNLDFVGKF